MITLARFVGFYVCGERKRKRKRERMGWREKAREGRRGAS